MADSIKAGSIDIAIAGGVESMSNVPLGGNKMVAIAVAFDFNPHIYTAMGATAEIVAKKFDISRQDQDEYAVRSHQRASAAIAAGKFKDEIVPLKVRTMDNGKWKEFVFDTDEGPRADTTYEALAKLKPVFDPKGTVTAGNASQINDGAGMAVVMGEDKAKELGLKPLAYVREWAVAGVPPEIMGIGPAKAVPKLLKKTGSEARGHRPHRDQRGLREPEHLLLPRAGPGPREDERERRRHRHGPPPRRHGRHPHREAPRRDGPPQRQARHRHHVHRRRHGLRVPARTGLSTTSF